MHVRVEHVTYNIRIPVQRSGDAASSQITLGLLVNIYQLIVSVHVDETAHVCSSVRLSVPR